MQARQGTETEPRRRDDAGTFKITDRDITGLVLCAERYGAPYDLLAAALDVTSDRLRGIVAHGDRPFPSRLQGQSAAKPGTGRPKPASGTLTLLAVIRLGVG